MTTAGESSSSAPEAVLGPIVDRFLPVFRRNKLLPAGLAELEPGRVLDLVLAHPGVLYGLFQIFKQNLDAFGEAIGPEVLADAKHWDRLPEDIVVPPCHQSIGASFVVLMRECARLQFKASPSPVPPARPVAKRGILEALGLARSANLKPAARPDTDATCLNLLMPNLLHDWQLMLLGAYRQHLSARHLRELEQDGLLALRTPEAVEAAGSFDPLELNRAKKMVEKRFPAMLARNPRAVRGVLQGASQPERWRQFILQVETAAGPGVWDILARGETTIDAVMRLKDHQIMAFGKALPLISAEAIRAIQDLALPERIEVFIEASATHFGANFAGFFGDPASVPAIERMVRWIRANETSRAILRDLIPIRWPQMLAEAAQLARS